MQKPARVGILTRTAVVTDAAVIVRVVTDIMK